MTFIPTRRIAVVAGGLVLAGALTAPAAIAVVDPAHVIPCAAEAATGLTTLIDPTAPQAPTEIPAASCLAHP